MAARTGDRIAVESERVGERAREGSILEVLGGGDDIHYRVRWEDGHESVLFPTAGSVTVISKARKVVRKG